MPQTEVTSILELIFTEKSGKIENFAAGWPLNDLMRYHISLSLEFINDFLEYLMTHSAWFYFKYVNFSSFRFNRLE